MIARTAIARKFAKIVQNSPSDFFKALDAYGGDERKNYSRSLRIWYATIIPTIALGYAGAILLLWNIAAKLFGFPQWP